MKDFTDVRFHNDIEKQIHNKLDEIVNDISGEKDNINSDKEKLRITEFHIKDIKNKISNIENHTKFVINIKLLNTLKEIKKYLKLMIKRGSCKNELS